MKRILLFASLLVIVTLSACNSAETDELVEYHNSFVKSVNKKSMEVEQAMEKSLSSETLEEALEIQKNEVVPLVDEIESYIQSQKPETDAVKELHGMRVEQISSWVEAYNLNHEALGKMLKMEDDPEIDEMITESDVKFGEAEKLGIKADEKLEKMSKEYNVEFLENEE